MTIAAEAVLPCAELEATRRFFVDALGFRLETIFPADEPAVAVVSGYGLRLRLDGRRVGDPGIVRILGWDRAGERPTVAPNGTRIEYGELDPWPDLPPVAQELAVVRRRDTPDFGVGRAGMLYRDLIPGRQGGRFIASHIRIPDGGPVPDFVHYHKVRFQMIYCHKGWVRVVYEDQGEPFVLRPGDCVLQPPEIRHRVLESSDGLEVVEIGCPAEHPTHLDHDLDLPTDRADPDRMFGGQKFVRHVASWATWAPWIVAGYEVRDLGIGAATGAFASARVARRAGTAMDRLEFTHRGEFLFLFLLSGDGELTVDGKNYGDLEAGDAVTLPAGARAALSRASDDLSLLEVGCPADAITADQA